MDINGNVKKAEHNKNDKPAMYYVGKDRKTYTKEVPKEYTINNDNQYISGTFVAKPQEQEFIVKHEKRKRINDIIGTIIYWIVLIFLFFLVVHFFARAYGG